MSELTQEEMNVLYENAKHSNFRKEIKMRQDEKYDSHDVYYYKDKEHVGYGFIPKTIKENQNEGHVCLEKCPACERENYAMNVLSGYCTWCPFDANEGNRKDES